jgi:hypothetical protein
MESQTISIPPIVLRWSDWTAWHDLGADARSEIDVPLPGREPGVYEVRRADAEERLTIGRASNLRRRVRRGLVKGKLPHSAGARIWQNEDLTGLLVRWAVTDRPAAVEEELHKQHVEKFGRLPKYTDHT